MVILYNNIDRTHMDILILVVYISDSIESSSMYSLLCKSAGPLKHAVLVLKATTQSIVDSTHSIFDLGTIIVQLS